MQDTIFASRTSFIGYMDVTSYIHKPVEMCLWPEIDYNSVISEINFCYFILYPSSDIF